MVSLTSAPAEKLGFTEMQHWGSLKIMRKQ